MACPSHRSVKAQDTTVMAVALLSSKAGGRCQHPAGLWFWYMWLHQVAKAWQEGGGGCGVQMKM